VLPQTLENLDCADRRKGIAADADVSLDDGEVMSSFLGQYYGAEEGREIPAEVLTPLPVDDDGALDALFAERTANSASVSRLTRQVADLSGQLRAVHLHAHLAVRAQLTPEQIEQYVTLRGYGHAGTRVND